MKSVQHFTLSLFFILATIGLLSLSKNAYCSVGGKVGTVYYPFIESIGAQLHTEPVFLLAYSEEPIAGLMTGPQDGPRFEYTVGDCTIGSYELKTLTSQECRIGKLESSAWIKEISRLLQENNEFLVSMNQRLIDMEKERFTLVIHQNHSEKDNPFRASFLKYDEQRKELIIGRTANGITALGAIEALFNH